jgi:transposase
MPKSKPPYPPEFREEAVRLVGSSGRPVKEIAADLRVSEQTLRNWVFAAQVETGARDGSQH